MQRWLSFAFVLIFMITLASAAMTDNIQGYWTCNQTGNTLNDELAAHDGTNNGATASVSGIVGTSYQYAPNDYVDFGDAFNDELDGNDFTISVWVYPTSNDLAGVFVSKPAADSHTGIWWTNGKAQLTIDTGADGSGTSTTTTSTKSLNEWHHIAATYDVSTGLADLWIDGVKERVGANMGVESIVTGTTVFGRKGAASQNYFTGSIDEAGIWDRIFTDIEIKRLYNNGVGSTYPSFSADIFYITLNSPATENTTIEDDVIFNATILPFGNGPGGMNITNATLYVWYNNNSLFTNVTNTVLGNVSNTTTWDINNFGIGSYYWTVYTEGWNGTATIKQWALENNTLDYGYVINSILFNSTTYETSLEKFILDVTYKQSLVNAITGYLQYNGTQYVSTATGTGSNKVFTNEITIPTFVSKTNVSVFWELVLTSPLGNFRFNTTDTNQTINPINISLYDNPHTPAYINFSIFDEQTLNPIAVSFESTFNYGIVGKGKAFSYDSAADKTSFAFSFSPNTTAFNFDGTIEITGTDYPVKTYSIGDLDVTNITTNINLYLLNDTDSTSFIIYVRDSAYEAVNDARVEVERYYPSDNTWKVTESVLTNIFGKTIGHFVVEDVDYRFKVYIDDVLTYTTASTKVFCEAEPCTITITLPGDGLSGFDNYEPLANLTSSLTYSRTTQTFTYTYVDTDNTAQGGRLLVARADWGLAGDIIVCDSSSTATSAVLTCDISGESNATYIATAYNNRTTDNSKVVHRLVEQKVFEPVAQVGVDGVLWAAFLILTFAMLGLWKPAASVIFGIVGIILVSLLKIISLPVTGLVAVIMIGIFLLWEFKT